MLGVAVAASAFLLAGCAEDEQPQDVEAFCADFTTPTAIGGFTTRAEITQAATFFRQLEQSAPEEIAPQVSTVADGLDAMVEAFADVEGADGLDAVQGVQEAAGVDLDELGRAAEDVQEFAVENCDDVDVPS